MSIGRHSFAIIVVGEADAGFEIYFRFPAEGEQSRNVEEFARGAVRLGGVPDNPAGIADDFLNQFGQLADGDVVAVADVDVLLVVVILEKKNARAGKVVCKQEFASRAARAPAGDGGSVGGLGLVKLADECWQDVRVCEVVVVVHAVNVCGHDGDEVAAVLTAVGLAHLEASDLGDGVPLVCGFERTGEEAIFAHRLG